MVETDFVEFYPGSFAVGLLVGYSERSYGFGLFLALDFGTGPASITFVVGPFGFSWRRSEYWEFRLLRWHLIGRA